MNVSFDDEMPMQEGIEMRAQLIEKRRQASVRSVEDESAPKKRRMSVMMSAKRDMKQRQQSKEVVDCCYRW